MNGLQSQKQSAVKTSPTFLFQEYWMILDKVLKILKIDPSSKITRNTGLQQDDAGPKC